MKRIAIFAVMSSTFFVAVTPALAQRTSNEELPLPNAWIGVDIQRGRDDAGHSLKYPIIAGVYPNSPAESAGITAGDTVLKFGDIDASVDPFGLRRLLHPGRRVRLTLRHNGVRTVTVVPLERDRVNLSFRGNDVGSTVNFIVQLAPIAAPSGMRLTTVVAGASLVQMNADIAEVLHVQNQGVLVLEVVPETPAKRAGLKGGDVIMKADAVLVTKPATISQAISVKMTHDSADRHIALDVMRMGKERRVTLRW